MNITGSKKPRGMGEPPATRRGKNRRCNLCAQEFHPRKQFERYCRECREQNELLRFSEWLPEIHQGVTEKI